MKALHWQDFLPIQPFIEREFTSLGLHFSRICMENTEHSGTLENGYLVCISTGPPCLLTRQTENGLEFGQLSPGDIIITPPCQKLTWQITGKGEFTCVYASLGYIQQVAASLGAAITEPIVIRGMFQHKDGLVKELFVAIEEQLGTTEWQDHIYTEAMGRALCIHLLHTNLEKSAKESNRYQRKFSYEQMEKIRVCIAERLEGRILSSDLAKCVHVSDYHFYRIFKRTTGMTPQQFIKKYRVEIAKQLVECTALPLSEIAYRTGFTDQSHLAREFRLSYGKSPRQLRAQTEHDRNLSLAF